MLKLPSRLFDKSEMSEGDGGKKGSLIVGSSLHPSDLPSDLRPAQHRLRSGLISGNYMFGSGSRYDARASAVWSERSIVEIQVEDQSITRLG